jgi:hypothetical protein
LLRDRHDTLFVDGERLTSADDAGEALVDRARAAGAVRPDVRGDDVVVLMNAAAWVRTTLSVEQAERLVGATLAGLAP